MWFTLGDINEVSPFLHNLGQKMSVEPNVQSVENLWFRDLDRQIRCSIR